MAVLLLLALIAPQGLDAGAISYDRYSFMLDGRRLPILSGEFHYWRLPAPDQWSVVLEKIRAAGYNAVRIYFPWSFHSPAPGVYDFTGIRDISFLLEECRRQGLYVLAAVGPYVCGETDAGGLPAWLLRESLSLRCLEGALLPQGVYDPRYVQTWVREWLGRILPFLVEYQVTRDPEGPVILVQVENEYPQSLFALGEVRIPPQIGNARYLEELVVMMREYGIEVPLFHNDGSFLNFAYPGSWNGTVDLCAFDLYPFSTGGPTSPPPVWNAGNAFGSLLDRAEEVVRSFGGSLAGSPLFMAEFQGGWYDAWGGWGYDGIYDILGPAYYNILDKSLLGQGFTIANRYMFYGGTNWGYLSDPDVYTSYDYAAPIREWGALSTSYAAMKRSAMFVEAFPELWGCTEVKRLPEGSVTDPLALYRCRTSLYENPDGSHPRLTFLRNANQQGDFFTRVRVEWKGEEHLVPQEADAFIPVRERSMRILVSNHFAEGLHLLYSTLEILTRVAQPDTTFLVLYGERGEQGEAGFRLPSEPTVLFASEGCSWRWVEGTGELVVNTQPGEAPAFFRFTWPGATTAWALIVLDESLAGRTWRTRIGDHELLTIGPYYVPPRLSDTGAATSWQRVAPGSADVVRHPLIGDLDGSGPREQSASSDTPLVVPLGERAPARADLFPGDLDTNPRREQPASVGTAFLLPLRVHSPATTYLFPGDLNASRLGDPALAPMHVPEIGMVKFDLIPESPPALPQLGPWLFKPATPEVLLEYDDASWQVVPPAGALSPDAYGFHHGFVWYRGRYRPAVDVLPKALTLDGRHSYSVYWNGLFLGAHDTYSTSMLAPGSAGGPDPFPDPVTFRIPAEAVQETNVIAVLVESLGHNKGYAYTYDLRNPRGLISCKVAGDPEPTIEWRVQGRGEDEGVDIFNSSGLYGERLGFYQPDYDDRDWEPVDLPHHWEEEPSLPAGYSGTGWYRTRFWLDLPEGLEFPLCLDIREAAAKAVVWLNGRLIGRYWEAKGPQQRFYLPEGVLNPRGENVLVVCLWGRGDEKGNVEPGVLDIAGLAPYPLDQRVNGGTQSSTEQERMGPRAQAGIIAGDQRDRSSREQEGMDPRSPAVTGTEGAGAAEAPGRENYTSWVPEEEDTSGPFSRVLEERDGCGSSFRVSEEPESAGPFFSATQRLVALYESTPVPPPPSAGESGGCGACRTVTGKTDPRGVILLAALLAGFLRYVRCGLRGRLNGNRSFPIRATRSCPRFP